MKGEPVGMNKGFKTVLMCAIIPFFYIKTASSETLTWLISDWYPYQYLEEGEYKGFGIEMIRLLQGELTNYNHKFLIANTARKEKLLKENRQVCVFGIHKTSEREQFSYFTIPDQYYFPLVFFMRKETHQQLGSPSVLSLKELLEHQPLKLAVHSGRVYGIDGHLDKIFQPYLSKTIISVSHKDQGSSMFRMLLFKRFDYMMEFPEMLASVRKIGRAGELTSVVIKEHQQLEHAYTACPKNEWGRKTAENITQALLKLRPTDQYRQTYEQWIDPNLIPTYRRAYQDDFLTMTH